jgi:hypothetical protein
MAFIGFPKQNVFLYFAQAAPRFYPHNQLRNAEGDWSSLHICVLLDIIKAGRHPEAADGIVEQAVATVFVATVLCAYALAISVSHMTDDNEETIRWRDFRPSNGTFDCIEGSITHVYVTLRFRLPGGGIRTEEYAIMAIPGSQLCPVEALRRLKAAQLGAVKEHQPAFSVYVMEDPEPYTITLDPELVADFMGKLLRRIPGVVAENYEGNCFMRAGLEMQLTSLMLAGQRVFEVELPVQDLTPEQDQVVRPAYIWSRTVMEICNGIDHMFQNPAEQVIPGIFMNGQDVSGCAQPTYRI